MPDFTLKPTFPIATVIDAAGRNAQLQQQAQEAGQQQLVQGLQAIGQVGQSLYDQKRRVAQSLALGRQFGVPDDQSRVMDPSELLQIGQINKGNLDAQFMRDAVSRLSGTGGRNPGVPASMPGAATQNNGPILASQTTATPLPDTPAVQNQNAAPVTPPSSSPAPIPVPISAPPLKNTVNKATMDATMKIAAMLRPENVYTNNNGQLTLTGQVPKGSKVLPSQSNVDTKEQDKLEAQARQGLQSVRGDTALKNTEVQRDAAISAFNRLKQIEQTGKAPNPVDYIDILGQVYKARTGAAPTDQVLQEAKQDTAAGRGGKWYTFFTGQQAPGTTKEIAASLKDMVAHMGLQADKLHDGYMQVHGPEIFPSGLDKSRADRLAKVSRGTSFSDATGVKPEDYDPHVQAIKWAQANPNDPRSAPILQKAMQSMQQGQQGQNVGL